mmetsp:Transcript_34402/g.80314  ORF Transcript_34402/g.80314 Transcript_34402/m.80314 type:complete len:211 (+) Transcript_34402:259-891(+)
MSDNPVPTVAFQISAQAGRTGEMVRARELKPGQILPRLATSLLKADDHILPGWVDFKATLVCVDVSWKIVGVSCPCVPFAVKGPDREAVWKEVHLNIAKHCTQRAEMLRRYADSHTRRFLLTPARPPQVLFVPASAGLGRRSWHRDTVFLLHPRICTDEKRVARDFFAEAVCWVHVAFLELLFHNLPLGVKATGVAARAHQAGAERRRSN